METPDFEDLLTELALTSVMLVSGNPASEALSVPGEPRVVDGMLLNCLRFPIEDEADVPPIDDAVIGMSEVNAKRYGDLSVEPECHYINVHDVQGRWRLDVSFHYVLGLNTSEPEDLFPYNMGVVGTLLMGTSRVPEEQVEAVYAAVARLTQHLRNAYEAGDEGEDDPRWLNIQSTLLH
jgi:hypothetical protein